MGFGDVSTMNEIDHSSHKPFNHHSNPITILMKTKKQ
jgi:hypothetical protein